MKKKSRWLKLDCKRYLHSSFIAQFVTLKNCLLPDSTCALGCICGIIQKQTDFKSREICILYLKHKLTLNIMSFFPLHVLPETQSSKFKILVSFCLLT